MTSQILFFIVLCVNCSYTFQVKCEDNTTKTTGGIAVWKFRGVRYTTSEDYLCWKENWKLFLRECDTETGQWLPEKVVCRQQNKKNQYCPENLMEIYNDDESDYLCLKISPMPHKYDDAFCYGSNAIVPSDLSKSQLSNLLLYLFHRNIKEYWLPFRRDDNTMPIKIRLPGKHWGKVVDDDKMKILDFNSNRNCMSAQYINNHLKKKDAEPTIIMKDCQEMLHSICLFQDNFIAASGCPKGFRALSYRPNECYGVRKTKSPFVENMKISLKEYFQSRNILRRVLNKTIPKIKYDQFFEVDRYLDDSADSYVILMNRNEKVKVENQSSENLPILYKEIVNLEFNTVQLILKIDIELDMLILIVYNREYIWRIGNHDGIKCFTNADYDLLRETNINLIWENENNTKSIYKVKLVGKDPGEYWCECHTIQNFQLVISSRVVTSKETRGHTFSVKLNMSCMRHSKFDLCSNIMQKNVKRIAKHDHEELRKLSKAISPQLILHNTRIMTIEMLASNYTIYWIHITASLMNSAVDNSEEDSSEERDSLENEQRIRHDTSVRMKVWRLLQKLLLIYNVDRKTLVRSTEYCFPELVNTNSDEIFVWNQALRGQMATLSALCLQNNGMPLTRKCLGNFTYGAYWEELKEKVLCQCKNEKCQITKTLYSLQNSNITREFPEKTVKELKSIIQKNANKLLPADIHYTANILQSSVKYIQNNLNGNVSEKNYLTDVIKYTAHDIVDIYNYIVNVKKSTIRISATLNSTNKLLEAIETTINTLAVQTSENIANATSDETDVAPMDLEILEYVDIGVTAKVSCNFLYFIINPYVANISGIAIFQNDNFTDFPHILNGAFKHQHFRFLQSSHDIQELVSEPNLEFATYLPEKLLDNLNRILNTVNVTEKIKTSIVIKIYSNDKLFQAQGIHDRRAVIGWVVSISLPGHSTQLPENLPIVFRTQKNEFLKDNISTETDPCRYWNYENWAQDGIWLDLRIQETHQDIVICQVSHLTPFAYLVGFNITNVDDDIEFSNRQVHDQVLNIITVIGCSLSLLGICGIFITAATFQSWRQKPSSKVLLQLSAAIALEMIILCFVSTEEYSLHLIINKIIPSCVTIGAFLHYSVLVQFFWMMVIAYLQFKRYVQVFGRTRPTRFLMKSTLFCWGLPLLPVILVVLLDHNSFGKGGICYPSGYALYFGVILPIAVIVIANFIIFCLIIHNILLSTTNPSIRHTEKTVVIYQIRLSVLLFFLLGFTWFFGFLSTMKAGILFSYLFCLTATLQGFVIFLYFIILDPVTRRMWSQYFYKLCSIENNVIHSTSLKDTTDTS
ncbi:uncharacterized protein LOC133837923 [Drosophila sulfurigaster albostrigata]|uniref:uncharacterized protein LOC133837923 n=1 Tax=Drosophila sulfurigaster albostrigata TaxID=89887 RepID=UPI002D21AE25|nr:uncharacterized protein LOC133837923 [Drosophila sulfurigaster albostrigata]